MIDQDKMRALAKLLRRVHADCNNSLAAADAIDLLLAEVESNKQMLTESFERRAPASEGEQK